MTQKVRTEKIKTRKETGVKKGIRVKKRKRKKKGVKKKVKRVKIK